MPKSPANRREKLKSVLASAAGREGMLAALPGFGISEEDAQNLYNSARFITGVKEINAVSRLGKMVVVSFENVEPFKDMLPEL